MACIGRTRSPYAEPGFVIRVRLHHAMLVPQRLDRMRQPLFPELSSVDTHRGNLLKLGMKTYS
jgi:hypothetical protein